MRLCPVIQRQLRLMRSEPQGTVTSLKNPYGTRSVTSRRRRIGEVVEHCTLSALVQTLTAPDPRVRSSSAVEFGGRSRAFASDPRPNLSQAATATVSARLGPRTRP